ncbi:MAG: hypothetical protein O6929_12040 [candidate division NC10 bacterium]|nr:hypothetical protein [candidate division NC10 bacterium]
MDIYLAGGVKGLSLSRFIIGFFVICGVIVLFEYLKYTYGSRKEL